MSFFNFQKNKYYKGVKKFGKNAFNYAIPNDSYYKRKVNRMLNTQYLTPDDVKKDDIWYDYDLKKLIEIQNKYNLDARNSEWKKYEGIYYNHMKKKKEKEKMENEYINKKILEQFSDNKLYEKKNNLRKSQAARRIQVWYRDRKVANNILRRYGKGKGLSKEEKDWRKSNEKKKLLKDFRKKLPEIIRKERIKKKDFKSSDEKIITGKLNKLRQEKIEEIFDKKKYKNIPKRSKEQLLNLMEPDDSPFGIIGLGMIGKSKLPRGVEYLVLGNKKINFDLAKFKGRNDEIDGQFIVYYDQQEDRVGIKYYRRPEHVPYNKDFQPDFYMRRIFALDVIETDKLKYPEQVELKGYNGRNMIVDNLYYTKKNFEKKDDKYFNV